MVPPPSKRQKAQKPHSCAVFLLLKYFILFECKMLFCLRKIAVYFSILSTRGPTGFFDSLRRFQTEAPFCVCKACGMGGRVLYAFILFAFRCF